MKENEKTRKRENEKSRKLESENKTEQSNYIPYF